MSETKKEKQRRKSSKPSITIKNYDQYISDCSVDNLQILGKELRLYNSQPILIKKYPEQLKDLIQLLFKYLMDGDKNLEEDIIGCFKDEDIFNGIKDIYYHEDYDINCTIIQSLSILIVNIVKSKAFLYFILSNNFINDLLLIDYSKYDDEFYSYYVNFLKSLVMRLDQNTFLLFYNKRSCCFPILDCSLNLYNYSNAMTRTVVNNIILQILQSNVEGVYEHFTNLPSVNYFSFISLRMKDLIKDLCENINNLDPYEDLTDITLFINDLLSLNKSKINFMLRNAIFYHFILPDIFQNLYALIYGYESVKGDINDHQNKKESVIILCIITFLINIKDETITYILLQLLLSEYIPDKLNKYIITKPPDNPFYSYKWDKDFQNKLNFTKFISLNFSTEFLGSFTNKDNYHYREIDKNETIKLRELKNLRNKCEEICERAKIEAENKENSVYEMSQLILDIINEKIDDFTFMKKYHQNLGKGLGIKIGIIKKMFQIPKITNEYKSDDIEIKDKNEIDFLFSDIIKDCFMCDYKLWMENINNNNIKDLKFKPNVFKIILFNLLNNENNINVNIPLVIANNYFLWTIIHKLKIPSIILDHFHIQIYSPHNDQTPTKGASNSNKNSKKEEDEIYTQFVFGEDYLIKHLTKIENNDYRTNNILIEKLSLNLENKILLTKIELIYIELICKNINSLCVDDSPNKEKTINILKNTSINLIKLLTNIFQIPDNGFIEENTPFEEIACISLLKVASNINDDSYFNNQLSNLPKLMEIISEYESNKGEIKGNLAKNLILSVVYLVNILERLTKKNKSESPFKCLYKKTKYNLNEILEEKEDKDKMRFNILYETKSKIVFYDDLFLYHCYLKNGRDSPVEISDILFIKNAKEEISKSNDKTNFKINNEIIISFNCNEEGDTDFKKLEDSFKELKEKINNNFPKNYSRLDLKNILKYVEEMK